MQSCFTKTLLAAAIAAAVGCSYSSALKADTLVGGTTSTSGIDGLVVDSVTYDVTFVNNSYNNTFPANPTFFGNTSGASDAQVALYSALNNLDVTGLVGLTPNTPYDNLNLAVPSSVPSGLTTTVACLAVEGACGTGTWGISQLTVDASGTYHNLDYAVFSVASAVPEPATWAMLLLGFAGVGFMAYRRKSKPTLMAA
jgi:hypothetical protein